MDKIDTKWKRMEGIYRDKNFEKSDLENFEKVFSFTKLNFLEEDRKVRKRLKSHLIQGSTPDDYFLYKIRINDFGVVGNEDKADADFSRYPGKNAEEIANGACYHLVNFYQTIFGGAVSAKEIAINSSDRTICGPYLDFKNFKYKWKNDKEFKEKINSLL